MANPSGCGLVKLGMGSSVNPNSCVKMLQQALNNIGNYGLVDDGAFGNKTFNAVVNYQMQRSLAPDGQVGDLTWTQIINDLSTGVKVTPGPLVVPSKAADISLGLPSVPGGINWTTIGIIAAIALVVLFSVTKEPERD